MAVKREDVLSYIEESNMIEISELIKDIDGCYLCSYKDKDVADKIHKAILFSKRTFGRDKILNLKLQIEDTANSIINIYTKSLTN